MPDFAPFVHARDPFGGAVVFAVSLLIGGGAIHAAADRVVYRDEVGGMDFDHAVVTALLGAVTWAVLASVPLVGSLLALVGWIAVIRWRYPGGWAKAAVTGGAAWAASVVVLAVLDLLGIGGLSAVGVPGT